uniref:Uncharacterized protein n=1 Tax=Solanum tuberosum TaxID=4113 RepID=M1DTW8_SOLTU
MVRREARGGRSHDSTLLEETSREEHRRLKKTKTESKRVAKEKEELDQQQRDALRSGDFGIWIEEQSKDTNLQKGMKLAERIKKSKPGDRQVHLALVPDISQPDTTPAPKRAPIGKGAPTLRLPTPRALMSCRIAQI